MVYITLLQWKIVEEETNNKTTTRRFLDEETRSPKSLTTPSMRTPSTHCCSRGKVLWKAKNVAVPLKRAPTPTENGKNHEPIALRQNYLQHSDRTAYNKAIHGKTRTQKSRFQRKTDPELNVVSLLKWFNRKVPQCLTSSEFSIVEVPPAFIIIVFNTMKFAGFVWLFGFPRKLSDALDSTSPSYAALPHFIAFQRMASWDVFFSTPRPRWNNLRWDLRPNFESCCVNRNIAL